MAGCINNGKHEREENLEQNFENMKEIGHSGSLWEFGTVILKWNLNIVLWEDKTSKSYPTGWTFTHTLNFLT